MGYLDNAGLAHFWEKVRTALAGKQDALAPDETIRLQNGNIGVSLPTKTVTKAEYDALTEAEKQAETVYLVDEPAWTPAPLSIQEYDTNDGWHVRKWSDGYVEMTNCSQVTLSGTADFLSWATINGANDFVIDLPFKLKQKYYENARIWSNEAGSYGPVASLFTRIARNQTDADHTSKTETYVGQSTLNSSLNVTISIFVAGRWK